MEILKLVELQILLPETIGKALEDSFREAGVTSRRASVGVPLRSTLVTHVTLPMHDERNLPAMIALEARNISRFLK